MVAWAIDENVILVSLRSAHPCFAPGPTQWITPNMGTTVANFEGLEKASHACFTLALHVRVVQVPFEIDVISCSSFLARNFRLLCDEK